MGLDIYLTIALVALICNIGLVFPEESGGVENCYNKCQNTFDNTQYTRNALGDDTYKYSACRVGCNICNKQIAISDPNSGACFDVCKDTNWLLNVDINNQSFPIVKGVVEPDKACIFGCIIDTCQFVCTGGTPDFQETPQNADLWWDGNSTNGCSIKTGAVRPGGYYSQNAAYTYYNNPLGAGGVSECCSNALSLCNYAGPTDTLNYKNVLAQAQKGCSNVPGPGRTQPSICKWFVIPSNCGSPLG